MPTCPLPRPAVTGGWHTGEGQPDTCEQSVPRGTRASRVARGVLPAKAEYDERHAQESGNGVPDQGADMLGAQVQAEPEGSQEGERLTGQEVHLWK